jgi:hypothetical protein
MGHSRGGKNLMMREIVFPVCVSLSCRGMRPGRGVLTWRRSSQTYLGARACARRHDD